MLGELGAPCDDHAQECGRQGFERAVGLVRGIGRTEVFREGELESRSEIDGVEDGLALMEKTSVVSEACENEIGLKGGVPYRMAYLHIHLDQV